MTLCSVLMKGCKYYKWIGYVLKLQISYLERGNKYLIKDGKTNTSGHLKLHLKEPHDETHFKPRILL